MFQHHLQKIIVMFAVLTCTAAAWSQALDTDTFRNRWIGTTGAWDAGDTGGGEGTNWSTVQGNQFQPAGEAGGTFYNEYASIANGGTAYIDSAILAFPVELLIGELNPVTPDPADPNENGIGMLELRTGGSFVVKPSGEPKGFGQIFNGARGGTGTLILQNGFGLASGEAHHAVRYFQNANSTFQIQVADASAFSPLKISEVAHLGGNLVVEPLGGFAFEPGQSWTVMQADHGFEGNFASISTTTTLGRGQSLEVNKMGTQLNVTIAQDLVLEVDRLSGSAILINPAGHTQIKTFDSYTLLGADGSLDSSDARWSSLEDQGGTGFTEAGASSASLAELHSQAGGLTLNPGDSQHFGTPFNTPAQGGTFGQDFASGSASFAYTLADGTKRQAVIETVGRYNNLVLVVDPATGEGKIQNQSSLSVDIDVYKILSGSGALLPGSWISLEDNAEIDGWAEGNPNANALSELNAGGSLVVDEGDVLDLGTIWDTNGTEDILFQFVASDGTKYDGVVVYGDLAVIDPSVVLGDVNGDGLVNGFDVDPFVDVLLNGPYQAEADVNEDGAVNGFDVDPFVALVLGGGSGPQGTEVPEPATLAILGLGGWLTIRRRK